MGTAWKKNTKNLLGHQDITGHDVIVLGTGVLGSGAAATWLPDAFGVGVFTMPRNARLEGAVAQVQGGSFSTGSVGVDLWAGGSSVGSGIISSVSTPYTSILLDKENGNEVKLVAGDQVFMRVQVNTAFDVSQSLTARIHLSMLEA